MINAPTLPEYNAMIGAICNLPASSDIDFRALKVRIYETSSQ